MHSLDFINAAVAAGLSAGDASIYALDHDQLGQDLQAGSKRLARFLNKAFPGHGQRKMLEVVAMAAGFPHWHAFQQLIQDLNTSNNQGEGHRANSAGRLATAIPALALLLQVKSDRVPSPAQQATLHAFGRRLAGGLGVAEVAARDVLARLQAADTWAQLVALAARAAAEPLYQFQVEGPDSRFVWSEACDDLVEALDQQWLGYEDMAGAARADARAYVIDVTTRHPDFLEGQLALGRVYELDGEPERAGPVYAQAIQAANALLPKGYRGKMAWGFLSNRFYHRLLFSAMQWQAEFGSLREAVRLAKRQLSLNPNDNLGVRISLPALQAAAGDQAEALKRLKGISGEACAQDGHMLLVHSLCHLANGDPRQGKEWFLRALFAFPTLRPLILNQALPADFDTARSTWSRGVIPDVERLWFDFALVCRYYPRIEALIWSCLKRPAVREAEAALAAQYHAVQGLARSDHQGFMMALRQWQAACMAQASGLASSRQRGC